MREFDGDSPDGDEYHGKDEILPQKRHHEGGGGDDFHHKEEEHVETNENGDGQRHLESTTHNTAVYY